jgi:predicted nucleic acid-binding protein
LRWRGCGGLGGVDMAAGKWYNKSGGDMVLKIYLDNCCYNRPFDDLTNEKNALEAKAIEDIISKTVDKKVKIYNSAAIEYELSGISEGNKKNQVEDLYDLLDLEYVEHSQEIENRVDELEKQNVRHMDAYHIAYSEKANVDYLITTDKQMLNAGKKSDAKIKIINPVELIMGGDIDE